MCIPLRIYRTQEKYEQLKANSNVQVGSEADDHLFLKASGGWSNKGTIYGLGREGPSMFERPAKVRRVSGSTSAAYTSPVVTELQGRLQSTEDELQTTRAELLSTREELQTTKEELAATKKQLDDTRLGLLELNARFDSFSSLLGHPTTRAGALQDST